MRLLDVNDLHIYYGAIKAVKGISFYVEEGEIVALIGANGAGKTSTLRAITGLEKTAAGSIKFKGKFMIGIINMYEGSGMVEDDVELDCSFEFKRSNLRISEQETYSYERVFGAYSDYHCDTPIFSFQEPESKVEVNNDLVYHQHREDEYEETFRKGKCTCGDRNMSRHRHVKAVNGWGDLRCEDCGTTWYCD